MFVWVLFVVVVVVTNLPSKKITLHPNSLHHKTFTTLHHKRCVLCSDTLLANETYTSDCELTQHLTAVHPGVCDLASNITLTPRALLLDRAVPGLADLTAFCVVGTRVVCVGHAVQDASHGLCVTTCSIAELTSPTLAAVPSSAWSPMHLLFPASGSDPSSSTSTSTALKFQTARFTKGAVSTQAPAVLVAGDGSAFAVLRVDQASGDCACVDVREAEAGDSNSIVDVCFTSTANNSNYCYENSNNSKAGLVAEGGEVLVLTKSGELATWRLSGAQQPAQQNDVSDILEQTVVCFKCFLHEELSNLFC